MLPKPCPPDPWPQIGEAWQKMQQFREVVWQVLLDMSMTDPQFSALLQSSISRILVTDPNITQILQTMIDQATSPGTSDPMSDPAFVAQLTALINGSIAASKVGVTDGSNAATGQIGEFISATVSVPYPGYPTDTDTTVNCLLVPPGDWTITASVIFSGAVGPIDAMVTNAVGVPLAGMSHRMLLVNGTWSTVGESQALPLPSARASFTTATMLPVRIMVKQSVLAGLLAGTADVIMEARRIR